VVAAISNWAGYAIAAGVALASNRPEALHTLDVEEDMLAACARAGAVDGLNGRQMKGVDGTSAATQTAILTLVPYLDTLRWVFIAVALAGIAVTIYARLDDWKKGLR